MPYQVFAYLSVGAANTLLNIGLFILLYLVLAKLIIAVEIATVISFGLTVFTGFWLNKNFAFTDSDNSKKQVHKQFGKYFLVSLQGQFTDYLITKMLIVILYINPTIAYLISTVIMLSVTYVLQKYYTFRRSHVSIN